MDQTSEQIGRAPSPAEPRYTTGERAHGCLDVAARSFIEGDLHTDSATLVARRALDHHWQDLFQFAAARSDAERATAWLEQLAREQSRALEPRTAPSARAWLYRRMYEKVTEVARRPLPPSSPLWHEPREPDLRRRLVALRGALSARQRDVLELRYARSLDQDDIAYALDLSAEKVAALHAAGLVTAERMLGARPRSWNRTLSGALLECFALDPRRLPAPQRPAWEPVLRPKDVVADRYEVEVRLDANAFADIYRARDRDVPGHVVVLKILRDEAADDRALQSALRELQTLASVFHPSVVQLKDHGWHRGKLWFVMPLYEGETLAQRLQRGPLDRREARQIFEPLAEALGTMHRAGVLHQDIKPENVFLAALDRDENGKASVLPVLLDLGVAAKGAELVLAGTPAYLAPEVAARLAGRPVPLAVGPKADVFSLALTLLRALDPEALEEAPGGAVDAFVRHRASTAPPPPDSPQLRDLHGCFARWLHFSPDERPSAEELRQELSVLTQLQERRARRGAMLRAAAPIIVAVLSLCGATVYGFSREAELRRSEATDARLQVASVSQSLERQREQRLALEEDVARLSDQYEQSRMTRTQLASRLAEVEAELHRVDAEWESYERETQSLISELRNDRDQLQRKLDRAQAQEAHLREWANQLSGQLHGGHSREEQLEEQVAELSEALRVHRAALEERDALLRSHALESDDVGSSRPLPYRDSESLSTRSSHAP